TLVKLSDIYNVPCGYLLGEDFLKFEDYVGSPEVIAKITKLLRILSNKVRYSPTEVLEALCSFLEADPQKLGNSAGSMVEEEEIFGLWWSIMTAYKNGDWHCMIEKTDDLLRMSEKLGRPFLAAIARIYKAQAFRNFGGEENLEKAEKEFNMLPSDSNVFESALINRLKAKLLRRREKLAEAIDYCKKAENLTNASSRGDALFLLERVKLMRYIAVLHSRLAKMKGDHDNEDKSNHNSIADKYFKICEGAIRDLEKYHEQDAENEKMLLSFAKARHFYNLGKLEDSLKFAELSHEIATESKDENYAIKVKMYLVHILNEMNLEDKALNYFATLLPKREYIKVEFKKRYEDWFRPYEKKLSNNALK
ncbi:hypothetical protein ACFL02_07680, partial [Planctomycetota bacterium]